MNVSLQVIIRGKMDVILVGLDCHSLDLPLSFKGGHKLLGQTSEHHCNFSSSLNFGFFEQRTFRTLVESVDRYLSWLFGCRYLSVLCCL